MQPKTNKIIDLFKNYTSIKLEEENLRGKYMPTSVINGEVLAVIETDKNIFMDLIW